MISFSVLMSLYAKERPEFLRQSLYSVFNQTLLPTEIVLVEDGPLTKELYDVLDEFKESHSELKIISLSVNGGLGKALNKGLKHCSYELVARMDTDDIAKPDRFEKQINFMERNPDISVCSSNIDEFIDSTDNIISTKKIPEKHREILRYAKKRCPINHPAVFYKKKDVINCGGYGPFPEDYYLWAKMLKEGYQFYNIQEPLLWFRTSNDVYKRRGGFKYFRSMAKLQTYMYKIHFITLPQYLYNLSIRSIVSLIPNSLRKQIYNHLLRQ